MKTGKMKIKAKRKIRYNRPVWISFYR